MAIETINGTLQLTRLTNESPDYIARRDELRLAEIELMRQREHVAAMRRQLPPGAVVQDYSFQEGPRNLDAGDTPIATVRLSDLFTAPARAVMIYHLAQNVDFAIAAAADPVMLRQHARNRGWRHLRLLSCGDSTFKYDLRSEDAEGAQDSTISVFTRDRDGTLRHSYSAHPWMAADVKQRGIDLLTPVYNLLDLTPQGRDDWYAKLTYSGARV